MTELLNLIKEFDHHVSFMQTQNNQISQIVDAFYVNVPTPITTTLVAPPSPSPEKESIKVLSFEDELNITMMQEELKIYQIFKKHYDETIDKITKSQQNQIGILKFIAIDQVKDKLISNQELEAEYQKINDKLHEQIKELAKSNKELNNEKLQFQQEIIGLQNETQQKNLLISKWNQFNEILVPLSPPHDNKILTRMMKNISILKEESKKYQKQAKFLQKQSLNLNDGDSLFWKDKYQQISHELQAQQIINHSQGIKLQQLKQQNIQLKSKNVKKIKKDDTKINNQLIDSLLEQNKLLRIKINELNQRELINDFQQDTNEANDLIVE